MRSIMPPNQNEAHLVSYPAGHKLSVDCWCEPSKIYWTKTSQNIPVLIVEHRDDVPYHHNVILHLRANQPDWITKVLDTITFEQKIGEEE